MMARYLANDPDDPINARMLLGGQITAPGPHTVDQGRPPMTILPAPQNGAPGRVAVKPALAQNEHGDDANPPCKCSGPTTTTHGSRPAADEDGDKPRVKQTIIPMVTCTCEWQNGEW